MVPDGKRQKNYNMLKIFILAAVICALAALSVTAQTTQFLPKHLAVLRAGDGVVELTLKQSPVFVDQYAPGVFNNIPSFTVKIPTNGPDTLFFNGHAATEGILTLSSDHRLLAFAGYGGVNLLATQGTPSLLDFKRGFCTVDAAGQTQTLFYRQHGGEDEKMNPRGVVTDGNNNFWGCGNALGTVFCNPTGAVGTVTFREIPTTRSIKIINHTLYTTLNNADATASDLPAGIFSFVNQAGVPVALPQSADTSLQPVVRAQEPYTKIAGFDLNPEERSPTPPMWSPGFRSMSRRVTFGSSLTILSFPRILRRMTIMQTAVSVWSRIFPGKCP